MFQPKALPRNTPLTPATGYWVVDPQDHAAFFVPIHPCDGIPSTVWRAEAMKAINQHTKKNQNATNAAIVLIVWPLEGALNILSAYATGLSQR